MNAFVPQTDMRVPPAVPAPATGSRDEPPADRENPPEVSAVPGAPGLIGDYRVLDVLGRGGMGTVYRVYDPVLKRQLAVKLMHSRLTLDPVIRARFVREAQAQAAVVHDHVVSIFHVGQDRGVPFIAMPVLIGQSLATALDREPLQTVAEVLRIGGEVAEGLAVSHSVGLVHRDVKPGNIWLEGAVGRVKLLDFGIARRVAAGPDGTDLLTALGTIIGTPAYMSPEQAQGRPVDCRSDLFSFGTVLYQMATGHRPFQGPDVVSVLFALTRDNPLPPVVENPVIPPILSALIMRLLTKQPGERPTSARHVADELRRIAVQCG
jgi:serine/threonine protein kinase